MASSRSPSPALRGSNNATPTPTRRTTRNPFLLSESSSSEDDDILRPRGKMAARMQVRGNAQQESESEAEDIALPTRDNGVGSPAGQVNNDGENEDVVTSRPRKLMSRRERSSTPETRPQEAPSSPGLFVSPPKPQSPSAENVQSDDGMPTTSDLISKNPRFQALVAKKRKERLAREAEEARKKAERRLQVEEDEEDDNITDDEGGRKLTQEVAATRAPRKASKKAIEEMHRETQRLSRSLQLAHEAKVKKKITKASLFERFNFKPEGSEPPVVKEAPATSSRAPTPGSVQQSDAEMKDVETPPSSPPPIGKDGVAPPPTMVETTRSADVNDEITDGFPTLEEIVERKRLDKGKGKATAADLEQEAKQQPMAAPPRPKRNLRVKLPSLQANTAAVSLSLDDDDDDDLQIQPTRKTKLDAIFDRVPLNQAKQPRALQQLRKLAQLDDPDKKGAAPAPVRGGKRQQQQQNQQPAMTVGELQATLLQRARLQAKLERDRQLEMLRAKGVHVQTAEEREKELQEVEDIVAKARQEAEEIMEREREAAKAEKKARRKAGEEDPLGWDDSEDDEEYEEEEGEEVEIELSGSDEEEEEGEEEGEGEDAVVGMFDEDAEESETGDVEEQVGSEDDEENELLSSKQVRRRAKKHVTILSDDEADDEEPIVKATPRPKAKLPKSPSVRNAESPSAPTSVLRSATKTFIPGLPVAGPAGLGLTQIFAGTMDDSQMGTSPAASPSQPRPTFDVAAFPDSNFSQSCQEAMEDMILNSQPRQETQNAETQGVQFRFSQSQMHGFDTFLENQPATQASDLIEPTQDSGFKNFSPLLQRFVEPPVSTVATVKVDQSQADDAEHNESPLVRRTGKLRRRADIVPESPSRRRPAPDDEDEPMEDLDADEFGFGTVSNNAFAAMKEAVLKEKKRKEAFDKKKSKAREMVQEQAEESEDEYAGLGGVDGEDDSDDDDHSVEEMIDDETKDDAGDERKLAAFYADRERASDEKQVEKLFHDITTGMLRRKRNGNWDDLSDEDDGGEARRRMKRRQFAKMQRTLFADERISKVAENPRNQAFLRTIEDHGSDDDMDFIFAPPPAPAGLESQGSQLSASGGKGQPTTIPDSQPQSASASASRPPAHLRRTKEGKRPSNIGEIRESLSNLLDEPSSIIPATDPHSSSDEDEDETPRPQSSHSTSSNKENRNPRRTNSSSTTIIDRINLKRNSSSTSSTSTLAFATTSTSTTAGPIKVPALLRRATTNSLLSTSSSSSSSVTTNTNTNTNTKSGTSDTKIKKPAGKRSGVSYLARETERRAAVAESERRREARKFRGIEGRGKAVGGLFGAGRFE